MPTYSFRLRFDFLDSDRIEAAEPSLPLYTSNGHSLRLRSGRLDCPIRDFSTASVIGGPYPTPEAATSAANNAKLGLLIWGAREFVGLDLGLSGKRFTFTEYGLQLATGGFGRPLRNDTHGIDVFESVDDIAFVQMNVAARVGKSVSILEQVFSEGFERAEALSAREALALEIFASSFFDASMRSRFIAMITAVEALLEPAPRSALELTTVDMLEDLVRSAEISDGTKQVFLSNLQWFKSESIGQAGRRLSAQLLGGRTYLGHPPARFFTKCYEARSRLIHSGELPPALGDLSNLFGEARKFVSQLLLASAGVSLPQ